MVYQLRHSGSLFYYLVTVYYDVLASVESHLKIDDPKLFN